MWSRTSRANVGDDGGEFVLDERTAADDRAGAGLALEDSPSCGVPSGYNASPISLAKQVLPEPQAMPGLARPLMGCFQFT